MQILLIIALIIGSLIVLVFLTALFVKKEYNVWREITIDRPAQEVYDYLRHLKNQPHYNKWVMLDPDQQMTYTGTDGTVGFIAAWDSQKKQAGKGEQEITKLVDGARIEYEVRFVRPFPAKAPCSFEITALADGRTQVKWSFESAMNYPMNVMRLFINMEKILGKDQEESLINLKRVLENQSSI